MIYLESPFFDVSSTEIREKIKNKIDISTLVPEKSKKNYRRKKSVQIIFYLERRIMKLFVISDIHGSLYYLKKVMEIFEKKNMIKYLSLAMSFIMDLEILFLEIILPRKQ